MVVPEPCASERVLIKPSLSKYGFFVTDGIHTTVCTQWANIPVIIMTSDEEADTSDTVLALGADDCLKKPLGDGLLKCVILVLCLLKELILQVVVTMVECGLPDEIRVL